MDSSATLERQSRQGIGAKHFGVQSDGNCPPILSESGPFSQAQGQCQTNGSGLFLDAKCHLLDMQVPRLVVDICTFREGRVARKEEDNEEDE